MLDLNRPKHSHVIYNRKLDTRIDNKGEVVNVSLYCQALYTNYNFEGL